MSHRQDSAWDYCGDVNGKNSYGGYTGKQVFYGSYFDFDDKKIATMNSFGGNAIRMCTAMLDACAFGR